MLTVCRIASLSFRPGSVADNKLSMYCVAALVDPNTSTIQLGLTAERNRGGDQFDNVIEKGRSIIGSFD